MQEAAQAAAVAEEPEEAAAAAKKPLSKKAEEPEEAAAAAEKPLSKKAKKRAAKEAAANAAGAPMPSSSRLASSLLRHAALRRELATSSSSFVSRPATVQLALDILVDLTPAGAQ